MTYTPRFRPPTFGGAREWGRAPRGYRGLGLVYANGGYSEDNGGEWLEAPMENGGAGGGGGGGSSYPSTHREAQPRTGTTNGTSSGGAPGGEAPAGGAPGGGAPAGELEPEVTQAGFGILPFAIALFIGAVLTGMLRPK